MKAVLKSATSLLMLALLPGVASRAYAPALKPPAGAKVAIVMFEDMECPSCAMNYPRVQEAAKNRNVPVVLRDFPLGPSHPWSFEAAVWARFFDTKSEAAGRDFRAYIFKNQPQIIPGNLRQYVQKFADDNHIQLPFANDPEGKLRAQVQADHDLGMSLGINETPTVYVVSNTESRKVDSKEMDNLAQIVEDVQKRATPTTPAKSTAKKKAA